MPETQEERYIRGAGVGGVDGGKVLAVLGGLVLVTMLAVTAYLFSSTASANNSAENLARSGMTVTAEITRCEGISDGVGMGIEYYNCTAKVSAGGHTYQGLLHGSRVPRPAGSQVQAIMVPGDVSTLTLDKTRPASYLASSMMALASLLVLVVVVRFLRRELVRRSAPGLPAI